MIRVLGIKIIDRIKEAGLTQEILSKHSNVITTRLGFHEVTDEICSREAYILVHLNDNDGEADKFRSELMAFGGIEMREMNFTTIKEPLNETSATGGVEIIGLLVERDQDTVRSVQKLLTSYGCNIRTRLGVNEQFFGQSAGLIILELKGDKEQRHLLERDLKNLNKVHVRTMLF